MNRCSTVVIILILSASSVYAQSKEAVVKSVRDRYYRVNGSGAKLTKISSEGIDYFWDDNKFSIAKKDTVGGRFEYYYDL